MSNRDLTPAQRVALARHQGRPGTADFIAALITDFFEQRGDRLCGDDGSILGGVGLFHGKPVTVIGHRKGKTLEEHMAYNFGMPSPEGYRKAQRLLRQAEKFHRPVICFVDTPGAFCGIEAEERGQGEAIARNIYEMSGLKTPVVSIVIGEGESGGALAIATADEVWMLENSIYSILSPEGFASILWKDSKRAKEAAGVMKLTANHLKSMEIVEQVIPEPDNFTSANLEEVADRLDRSLKKFICEYMEMDADALVEKRYRRFRRM